MAAYARQAQDTQLLEHATEIKVWAERRAGELLRIAAERGERAGKGRPVNGNKPATLADLGISEGQSKRWQQVASIPEKHFETAVQMAKNTAGEVTTAFLLREARSLAQPHQPTRPARASLRVDTAAPYEPTTPKKLANAEGQKQRLEEALSMMSGCVHGLKSLDMGMMFSVLKPAHKGEL